MWEAKLVEPSPQAVASVTDIKPEIMRGQPDCHQTGELNVEGEDKLEQ